MPDISEIVTISIDVQSSAISRKGFNSLLCVGDADEFEVGFANHEVRKYTTYKQVTEDSDISGTNIQQMAQVAFAQQPAVPTLYIGRIDAATISSNDLDALAASNSEWFGYTHQYSDAANALTAASWCAANGKYAFFRQNDFTNQNLNTNYASSWYTDDTVNSGVAGWLDVAIASRSLAYIPGSYTTAFKTLELVGASDISATNESLLRAANVNQYSSIGGRNITWNGVAANGGFIDTYIGVLYLEARIREDVFAQLASVQKVPYTNAGTSLVTSAIKNRLDQSVFEGFLTNDPEPTVTAPLVSEIAASDKSLRLLPNVTFQAVTAGAIQTVQIQGTIVA